MFDVDLVTYKKRNSKNMFQTWRNYFDEKQVKKFVKHDVTSKVQFSIP